MPLNALDLHYQPVCFLVVVGVFRPASGQRMSFPGTDLQVDQGNDKQANGFFFSDDDGVNG